MATSLCEFELKVLRVCAGENVPDMQWGAAMGAALEFLTGDDLVYCPSGKYTITEKGHLLLRTLDAKVP